MSVNKDEEISSEIANVKKRDSRISDMISVAVRGDFTTGAM